MGPGQRGAGAVRAQALSRTLKLAGQDDAGENKQRKRNDAALGYQVAVVKVWFCDEERDACTGFAVV